MKHLYLGILLIGTGAAIAQPTLTQANYSPVEGEIFTSTYFDWDGTPPTIGAGIIWDFSSPGSTTSTQAVEFIDPATGTGTADFPGATDCGEAAAGAIFVYHLANSTQYSNLGVHQTGTGVSIYYSDPEILMQFPFTYTDSYMDDFFSAYVSGIPWERAGTTTVEAVGYGTIIMPSATIPNVLLVKTTQDYSDSSSAIVLDYYSEIYSWHKPGFHSSIFGLTLFDIDGTVSYDGSYIDDPALQLFSEASTGFSLFPNPVAEVLNVNCTGSVDQILIKDLSGRTIVTANENITKINVADLPKGVYFVDLWSGEDQVVRKFVKR